ncbi:WD40 repeat-like protein [Ascodesmis nigricans]|uniref:WD40 repeat-like protein n=1 Tax=Ascodesmis nigricans TaxID=341454 RepID=A0A4S2N364_9PEZI|nr:WD40 repeat-like protein [Ascodesmis nigricans]
MATAAVRTPVKSHSSKFSSRHGRDRMPLTPSPRARAAGNASPFTPPAPTRRDNDLHVDRKKYSNAPCGSLQDVFASLSLSPAKKATRSVSTPHQNNIASRQDSPLRLDLGVSEWALTGTGSTPVQQPKRKATRPGKTAIRINGDRFIPSRSASSPTSKSKAESTSRPSSRTEINEYSDVFGRSNLDVANSEETDDVPAEPKKSPNSRAFESNIAEACGLNLTTRILAFKPAAPESSKPIDLRSQYNRPLRSTANAQTRRRILTAPERVLDAPGLMDDYYLNLLDWGSGNQVAIGLERNVYIWSAESGDVSCLLETTPDTYVSSVKWSSDGAHLSVGLHTGDVQIWDVEELTRIRTMTGHDSRVGVMSWNKATLSTGSRSGNIFNHDVRIAEHKIAELNGHTSEVCGLEWRSDGAQLASGGNDNLVNIWDARSLLAPKFTKTNHKAAVKAIAWCPWQNNLLATGGGSYDRQIHFWNTTTGARVNTVDAGSQVTSLKWSTSYREIVSCHGAPENQMTVWSYPSLVKNVEIPAHETRVLHSALSPDGQILATAASDESLKFWKLFEKKAVPVAAVGGRAGGDAKKSTKQMTIR